MQGPVEYCRMICLLYGGKAALIIKAQKNICLYGNSDDSAYQILLAF